MTDIIPPGYLRVTDVLKPYSKLHLIDPKVVANAADRGKRVHKFCEMYALGMLITDVDPDCKGYVEAFQRWYDSTVIKPLHMEKRLNHEKYLISGAFDMLVVLKGDTLPTLVDIKTPANASPSWRLQTAAYRMLIQDIMGEKVARRVVVKLPKEGGHATVIEHTQHDKELEMYLNALELYRFFNA